MKTFKFSEIQPYLLVAILTAVLSSPLLINKSLHFRSDAVFHAGIAAAIPRSGIPPLNPFLAGTKLHYYWLYHALIAVLRDITSFDPPTIMVLLNFLSLFILLSAVYRIIILLSPGKVRNHCGLLGVILAGFGLNGWGWFLLVPRLLKNDLSLPSLLTRGVWSFLPRIVLSKWEGTMGFMATKFLVATPFSVSLSALAIALYALLRFFKRPTIKLGVSFSIFTILAGYLNLVVGSVFIIICLAFFLGWFLFTLLRPGGRQKTALAGLSSTLLILFLLTLYGMSLSDSSSNLRRSVYFHLPNLHQLICLAFILLPLWVLVFITFNRVPSSPIPAGTIFIAVSILMLGAGFLFLHFSHQQFKLPYLLALFLSVLIGSNLSRCGRKRALVAWLITLSTIPTSLLGVVAYGCSPPEQPISVDQAAIYSWMAKNLPQNAVIISERKMDLLPYLARRDAYLGCRHYLKSSPENRRIIRKRQKVLRELWRGDRMIEHIKEIQAELGQPVVLLSFSRRLENEPKLGRLYSLGEISLWELTEKTDRKRQPPGGAPGGR